MIYDMCPHGRHVGAVCLHCAEEEVKEQQEAWDYILDSDFGGDGFLGDTAVKPSDRQVNGDHYKSMAIQPSEFIYRNNLDWYEGNAVKYICRHRRKGGQVDVEKAIHYLELLLEAEYARSVENES